MNKILVIAILATNVFTAARAQVTITLKDVKEINRQCERKIQRLQNLLNKISFKDNNPADILSSIAESYDDNSRNKIFYNSKINFEDDINPHSDAGNTSNVLAETYLKDFNIKYEKKPEFSVDFTDIQYSPVKIKEYMFIVVRYTSNFGNRYVTDSTNYVPRRREAEIRVEKAGGNNWVTSILKIRFFNPTAVADPSEIEVPVRLDSLSTVYLTPTQLKEEQKKDSVANDVRLKSEAALADQDFELAKKDINDGFYEDALDLLTKAEQLKPFDFLIYKEILHTKRLIAENTFQYLKNAADVAKSEHDYANAIRLYRLAYKKDPASNLEVTEITPLIKKFEIISSANNRLESGDLTGTIKECDKVLNSKENPELRNELPELYLITALAYEKMWDNKPDEVKLKEKVANNFKSAIKVFPAFKKAHLKRAEFFLSHITSRAGYTEAINDYDALTTITPDNSPEKPLYFAEKAKLKDILGNFTGAIDDYKNAINLSKSDSLYFKKGELQYRMGGYANAFISIDSAIRLNNKNAGAYFYRGLVYVKQKNNEAAGRDFKEAEIYKISHDQSEVIDSISTSYLYLAEAPGNKLDFETIDSLYRESLKIRDCNYKAFYGQAEIRFNNAETLNVAKSFSQAKNSYRESIKFNKRAIQCNDGFSGAYFKLGLAHARIRETDTAMINFTQAIKHDNKNIKAYIERGNLGLELPSTIEKYQNATGDFYKALNLLVANYTIAKKDDEKDMIKDIEANQSRVHQLLGQALYYLDDYKESLLSLDSCTRLDKGNSEAFYYKGLVHLAQKDYSKSIDNFELALKIIPDYRYYFGNGRAYFAKKDFGTAIIYLIDAAQMDTVTRAKEEYYWLGLSYFKLKTPSYGDALKNFDVYAQSDSSKNYAAFHLIYGLAQLFNEKDSLAKDNFNYVINRCSSSDSVKAKANYDLGCYYVKRRDFEKALDSFKNAFEKKILKKQDIELEENSFLTNLNENKPYRRKYREIRVFAK